MTTAEQLRLDPLRYYDTSGLPSSAFPSSTSLPPPPQPRKKAPKIAKQSAAFVKEPWEVPAGGREVQTSAGKTERRMFDWDEVHRNGDEWSFEEVRARKRGLLGRSWRGEVAGGMCIVRDSSCLISQRRHRNR
jgi:checkpoint serine/threonine-protein kinase